MITDFHQAEEGWETDGAENTGNDDENGGQRGESADLFGNAQGDWRRDLLGGQRMYRFLRGAEPARDVHG